MTIAAGFVVRDGVLLCADTLHTDGATKEYREKIFPVFLEGAAVCFALAGNATIARMAIDDCMEDLPTIVPEKRPITTLKNMIRGHVARVHKEHVDARPFEERENAYFGLLVAIAVRPKALRLYYTEGTAIAPVETWRCIGIGRHVAQHIITSAYMQDMTVDEATILGIQVLSACKEVVDGVGGQSQFLSIRDNVLSAVVPHDVAASEGLTLDYARMTAQLLFAIGGESDERFRKELDRFTTHAEEMRKSWQVPAAPWRELMEALRPKLSGRDPLV